MLLDWIKFDLLMWSKAARLSSWGTRFREGWSVHPIRDTVTFNWSIRDHPSRNLVPLELGLTVKKALSTVDWTRVYNRICHAAPALITYYRNWIAGTRILMSAVWVIHFLHYGNLIYLCVQVLAEHDDPPGPGNHERAPETKYGGGEDRVGSNLHHTYHGE